MAGMVVDPERVVIWDTLPENDAGKVLKEDIRNVLTRIGPET